MTFPADVSRGVAFWDEPTVPKAEIHSKATALNDKSGSTMLVSSIPTESTSIETMMVALALWTELRVSSLLCISILDCPRITARTFRHATARVFTLMPPAVDCDAPPTHIRNIYTSAEWVQNVVRSMLMKPAVLGLAELKNACVTFQNALLPAKAEFHSKAASRAVPANRRMAVVPRAILVLMLKAETRRILRSKAFLSSTRTGILMK